jgi:O-acetylhomoserine (thiol)-lyase
MSAPGYPGFDTLSLHAGAAPDVVPVPGPSACLELTVLEQRIAALEGGVAGIGVASGQAALHLGLATIAGAGSHVVASSALPESAHRLLAHTLARFSVHTTFVDPRDPDAWRAAIRPETRVLFGAVLGNPVAGTGLAVLDIPRIAELAHAHDLPLLVDATLATPWLLQSVEHGADLTFHAAAGFLSGHGNTAGALLVDGGTFDWQRAHERSGRFAALCEPCAACDGRVFSEESTVGAFALGGRETMRDFGAALSPHDAGAILQGLDTLGLRMARHVATTRKLVDLLVRHAAVEAVAWPELEDHPDHALAGRLLPRGCGAVFSFTVRGGRSAARRLLEALRLFGRGAGVGGARSRACSGSIGGGIGEGSVCLSVGLEDADDLLEDLGRALKLSQKGT